MKKKNKDMALMGLGLVILSVVLHYVHYLIFQDLHHTMVFLVADLAFVPLEVFITSFIIDKMLESRENAHVVDKTHLLVGVFYSELGDDLLSKIVSVCDKNDDLRASILNSSEWKNQEYKKMGQMVSDKISFKSAKNNDLIEIKLLLDSNKDLVLNLLSNPALFEHECFTDMLMSIMRLRALLSKAEGCDGELLQMNMDKVCKYLIIEWCVYIDHLKEAYPEAFKVELENSPFN